MLNYFMSPNRDLVPVLYQNFLRSELWSIPGKIGFATARVKILTNIYEFIYSEISDFT